MGESFEKRMMALGGLQGMIDEWNRLSPLVWKARTGKNREHVDDLIHEGNRYYTVSIVSLKQGKETGYFRGGLYHAIRSAWYFLEVEAELAALKRAFEHAALCLFDVMKQEGRMGDEATEQVERDFEVLLEAS